MKNRKGISSVVGAVFSITALTVAVIYVAYMTNTLEKFNQEVISKNTELIDQNKEELSVVKSEIANNKFNITVQNTGTLPINVTRLWVTNKTGTNQVYKYDLNTVVFPGNVTTNIGQNLGLAAFDTQSYDIKLITERGNTEDLFITSPSQATLFMQLVSTPNTLPDQFTTTLVYQVMNNMSSNNMLLNLQPVITTSGTATPTLVTGPTPSSYPTLAQGDIATFVWVYTLSGADATSVTFNATLANAKVGNWVTSTATVKVPLSSLSAGTATVSTALGIGLLADNTLILHNETNLTPGGAYQMFTGDADAGLDGKKLMLNQANPSFFTNNGSSPISIPAGNWNASLKLRSYAVPSSLQGNGESMIFHFEDGQGVNPDNSEGSANRDLRIGGSTVMLEDTVNGNREASGLTWIATNSSVTGYTNQLYLASISTRPNVDVTGVTGLGLTWTQVVEQCGWRGQSRTEIWKSSIGSASTGVVNATLSGSSTLGAVISVNRFSGIDTASPIGNTGRSNTNGQLDNTCTGIVTSQDDNTYRTDVTTTVGSAMLFGATGILNRTHTATNSGIEIADFTSSSALGNNTAGIGTQYKYSNTAGSTSARGDISGRVDYSSVAVEIKPGPTICGAPTWQDTAGPHGSGAYQFDGINNCFESLYVISSADGNDIAAEPDTTSLWFKTNGQIASEQYLVFWSGSGTCNNCQYYKISLNDTGKILFQFKTSSVISTDVTTCVSTKDYDDSQWYNVIAVRGTGDFCTMNVTASNGTLTEMKSQKNGYSTSSVDADGRWHVATNKNATSNWFKGWIDDIMHWNNYAINSTQADDLSKTNYGTGAHKLNFIIDKTAQSGTFIQNIYTSTSQNTTFKDGKALLVNDDNAYGTSVNFTLTSVPQVILSPSERLNFTVQYVTTPTLNWEPFNVNMTIDDETMIPQTSFLQIPMPNATLPAYFNYDNDLWLILNVTNSGTLGSWLTFAGSRAVFDDVNGAISYAAIIQSVNDTAIDPNNDSAFLPVGSKVGLNYSQPKSTPSSTGTANLIPPGTYKLYLFFYGYDESGQISLRTKYAGQVQVN